MGPDIDGGTFVFVGAFDMAFLLSGDRWRVVTGHEKAHVPGVHQ